MSLAIPKSAILASLFGPFVVSKQFLAAMSLQIEDVRRELFMLPTLGNNSFICRISDYNNSRFRKSFTMFQPDMIASCNIP